MSDALHRFVNGFDIENAEGQRALARLIEVLSWILGRPPHLEGGRERISRNQSWLLSAAAHAVERLVGVRSMHALEDDSVAILHKVSAVRFWHDVDLSEHAKRLETAVPDWPELNDTIFWSAIAAERAHREATGSAPVTDPFSALFHECCRYEEGDFDRVLAFIPNRANDDDKLVAVTLAYRLVRASERPDEFLAKLRDEVEAMPELADHLEGMINWRPSKEHRAMEERYEKARRKRERRDAVAAEAPRSYVLHDIVYHAPWLHAHIADWVIDWLEANTARDTDVLRQAIYIAKSTDDGDRLSDLARSKVELQSPVSEQAKWYALWVDIEAESAITRLEDWLGSMPADEASMAAQHFITELLGDRRGRHLGTGFDSYRTPEHLKRLYTLMHQHIRAAEDIERAGRGAYSPGLRDDAQDARNSLFSVLCDIPGKATFLALRQLAEDHPNESSRDWMLHLACERAEKDGDLDDWADTQIREFNIDQSLAPVTNAQLFSVAVYRLTDIRAWLEDSDDSPYRTWQRAEAETEVRNLITGRLNDLANGKYTCAQENEMPNSQRPDIWMQAPDVTPVPIELKLLDNGWTGPELCERLRNQLAGDYLRAEAGGRGIMLLTWQGRAADRKWEIDGCRVDLNGLETALQDYWHSIARDWPDIDEVKVIVIDLTRRGPRSDT
ncbi:hypothetical protein KBY30_07690 [Ruegeria pomeroyi]|nr:hypothetical protein [Ruegeria pomeroyi]